MVKSIYYVKVPFSDFSEFKGRPILIFKELENDFLFLPLTSNLKRDGVLIHNEDLLKGTLKKKSVVVVPKISAIDKTLVSKGRLIAILNDEKYDEILIKICNSIGCNNE